MNRRTFLSLGAAALAAAQPTKKQLIVHADDVGMCHSVNVASIKALSTGAVQSASIMMPCPWVSEIAAWARDNSRADLGLHLTLTSEWIRYKWRPLSPPSAVPNLLDPDGFLFRDVRSVATRATAAEVETELRAQIAFARKLGIAFTHFDTHMGTLYARKDYFDVYTKLAKEHSVPCMIPRPSEATRAQVSQYPITEEMLAQKGREGFPLLDWLVTGVPGNTVEERKASYRKFLRELKPGVTKLIVHLAMDDPEIRAVTNSWEQRWADFLFFTSDEARALMKELDIEPFTYRQLGSPKA
ncbi:MAG: polysaccharide deacetylase family protein [Bryobacteraceae bacterium]|nr:polysaccharide deacetylase family protein [Bryobacteraceae bacterium]